MTMDIDVTTAADVLAPLRDESPAPPRIDLGQVRGEARRRLRRRRIATASGAVAGVAVVAVLVPLGVAAARHGATTSHRTNPATTSVSCTQSVLRVPDGVTMAIAHGGDPTGRYLIGRSYPHGTAGQPLPLIWDNGVPHKVPIPGQYPEMTAISSNGIAIGDSSDGTAYSAFIYRDGKLTQLGGATNVNPMSVNNAGTVVGARAIGPDGASLPVVWRTPTSLATDLPMPGPAWRGVASDVLNDGTIIGLVAPSPTSTAFQLIIWPPIGSFHLVPLPRLAGVTGADAFWIFNVSQGVIVGAVTKTINSEPVFYPVAYDIATGVYTDLTKSHMSVTSGNAEHWLVGQSGTGNAAVASLWTPGTGVIRLPTLAGIRLLDQPLYISDDGRVLAGQDHDKNGVLHAVVWQCH